MILEIISRQPPVIKSVGIMSDIYNIRQIRQRILERYRSDPKIRINVSIARAKRHTLQYTDVLTHNIEISDF